MSVGVDPSKLHIKKELTQIRKVARVLRDPGTTSSWRSTLSSARSTVNNHYYYHYMNNTANNNDTTISHNLQEPTGFDQSLEHHSLKSKVEKVSNSTRKEKKVFLYNWRTQKSESEQSSSVTEQRGNADEEESVDESLSDAPNVGGDSKSTIDTYVAGRYASLISKCKDTNLIPPIRQTLMKKKPRKNTHSVAILKHQLHQMQQQLSLVDQSDDTEEYLNSEDLKRVHSAASPLLSRLKTSKLLRGSRKEDNSSYTYSTPALSTSSFNKYWVKNPSTIGSWDATTSSFNDDEEVDDQLDLPGRQGCGIPCYWSSKRTTPKRGRICGSCYSPSFSDTLRRTGSSILCGRQTVYHHRRLRGSSTGSYKKRLICSGDGGDGSSAGTDDELSTNFGELDMEALSRLDGRRWSTSCRSQEGLELVALNVERGEGDSTSENSNNSLSQKYRPMFFEDLVGQNVVVQSLINAILRGRIAPIYLFQGPRGTGKTSTARIFAAALSCLSTQENKPCGVCRECGDFISGKSRTLTEIDGSNKKGIDGVRHLLKNLHVASSSSTFTQHKVYIIDECHLLPSKLLVAFLKFLEKPPPGVVFIFITTDLDNVPRTVLSQCQKYLFNKIKDGDIVTRLKKISADEDLDVESDALHLIAQNVEGSLRDAETMLDQLSLLGKRITTSMVNELVGVVSDEKLLELLELAMSSDTAETVKRARELMDSGVDPMVLMSQLATLIMDIIAGTYQLVEARYSDSFFDGRSLTEAELGRLKHALKLLSEAEKQLRVSSERSTWFTATLLQLGSVHSPGPTQSGSSRRQSSKITEDDPSSFRDAFFQKQRHDANYGPPKSTPLYLTKGTDRNAISAEDSLPLKEGVCFNSKPTHSRLMSADALSVSRDDFLIGNTTPRCINSDMLDDIWVHCIERCHSKTLRQLLQTYGKLVSIFEVEGVFVAYIAFGNREIKIRAERFLSSITNSFEIVLRRNIVVRIILLSDDETSPKIAKPVVLPNPLVQNKMTSRENKAVADYSDLDSLQEPLKAPRGSFNDSECKVSKTIKSSDGSPLLLIEGSAKTNGSKGRKLGNPVQRIESIIHEQRLETAWLQTAEKGTPGSMSHLKPERNQVLPQDGIYHQSQMESINPIDLTSQHWEDELTHEINHLKIHDGKDLQKEPIGKRIDHYPMSPSLLHDSSLVGKFSKESMGYESGSGAGGCSGLLCWNNKPRRRGKIKQGIPVGSHKSRRFLWFGECAKSTRTENRF